jgi:B-cell receptor-associated protein 31
MIQLLFILMAAEMVTILLLLFKTPLRKFLIMTLDRVKRGRAPLVVKTVAATVFVIMMYSVYSIRDIQSRPIDVLNPTDQVLLANHMLEASLMGFLLFLSLMIDRLHHYIRELRLLRKTMEAAKKQSRSFEEGKSGGSEELKTASEEVSNLKSKISKLESECETKEKEARSAEANSVALKNQSDGFLSELDRLQSENKSLRSQLQSIDQSFLSHSDGKKNT